MPDFTIGCVTAGSHPRSGVGLACRMTRCLSPKCCSADVANFATAREGRSITLIAPQARPAPLMFASSQ